MQQPIAAPYLVTDFIQWNSSEQLQIAPKFQRRDVWIPKAKSYLIDTILRGMPIPPLFIRLKIDPSTRQTIREVVDGQQRLRAVLGYLEDEFSIMEVHNREFAGLKYSQLPSEVQARILSYKFHVCVLEDVSDADVLAVFARINTYTVRLNAQELRNAEFFGALKQTVYTLAHDHYAFWRNYGILSDQEIARMGDAELVSELLVSMLDGIRQTKADDLHGFYEKFDDEFPYSDAFIRKFESVINTIGELFERGLKDSEFKREPLFYSLFCAILDAKFGLPGSKRPRVSFTTHKLDKVAKNLRRLSEIIATEEPPRRFAQFVKATKRATADPGKRRLRHKVIWEKGLSRST